MDRGQARSEVVERVREATDLVEMIGQFVNLKRSGRSFKGLCPFHNEKTPSFTVSPERQLYHCFGCSRGGDVFAFLMEQDGVSFPEALRALGQRAGIEVESRPESSGRHDALYAATERAAVFYTRALAGPAGEPVRRYLKERGLRSDLVERFRLGMAPNAWGDLGTELEREGVATETLLQLGLVSKRAQGSGTYDMLRNRLVIPIVSLSGRVVGFGGRVLPGPEADRGPKYLNTRESPIYTKNRLLYGLGEARAAIRRRDGVVLTEGYLDFLSLYQVGIEHVVASCGTAFSVPQALLLRRYTRRAYILGDGDPAGRRAAVRTAGLLLEHGFLVYVVELPGGYDPDSFVREHGAESLETRLREAQTYIAYMKLWVDRKSGDFAVKERVVRHLLRDLSRVSDPLLVDLYGKELVRTFDLSAHVVEAALRSERSRSSSARIETPTPSPPQRVDRGVQEAQKGLLRLGLAGWVERLVAVLEPGDFDPGPPRRLFEVLARCEPGDTSSGHWLRMLESDEDRSWATSLAIDDTPPGEPERLLEDYVAVLKAARRQSALEDLRTRIADAERKGDQEALRKLVQEERQWGKRATQN